MLIDWAKDQEERAEINAARNNNLKMYWIGKSSAFYSIIHKLNLLVNHDMGAITETAISANTVLGNSAAEVGTTNVNAVAAGSCETGSVRQNEQTKEVPLIQCQHCGQQFKNTIETQGHRCMLRRN